MVRERAEMAGVLEVDWFGSSRFKEMGISLLQPA
jgi:hypothetical protein